MHSCKYKDAKLNGVAGKKVLVVGMGNSAVDVATNAATEGGYGILTPKRATCCEEI